MEAMTQCTRCRWWEPFREQTDEGTCHRHAPEPHHPIILVIDGKPVAVAKATWPVTKWTDWCGDAKEVT